MRSPWGGLRRASPEAAAAWVAAIAAVAGVLVSLLSLARADEAIRFAASAQLSRPSVAVDFRIDGTGPLDDRPCVVAQLGYADWESSSVTLVYVSNNGPVGVSFMGLPLPAYSDSLIDTHGSPIPSADEFSVSTETYVIERASDFVAWIDRYEPGQPAHDQLRDQVLKEVNFASPPVFLGPGAVTLVAVEQDVTARFWGDVARDQVAADAKGFAVTGARFDFSDGQSVLLGLDTIPGGFADWAPAGDASPVPTCPS